MPQISKGARLTVYRRKGRAPVYAIRDGRFFRSTGCGLDDRSKAEEALADYITSRRPDTSRRHTHEIGVAEVLNLYQMDLPQNKPSRELVGYHVANLLTYWGDKSLAQVKGSTCRAYTQIRTSTVAARNGAAPSRTTVKPSTARRELKTLSAAINHWHRESPLVAVPKVTLPEEGARRERVLERSEVARMLWACRKRKWKYVARFILIGVYTGTRKAAILNLQWHSALKGGHIELERGIIFRRGAAEKETSKRRPPTRIEPRLHAHLSRWAKLEAYPLRTVIQYQGVRVASIKRAWRTICNDAGLNSEVVPHTLRHTAATWLLWQGRTIWEVAGILGADASTIERCYGHHRVEKQEKRA
jgi:integrase